MTNTPDKSVEEQKAHEQAKVQSLSRQLVEDRRDVLPGLRATIQQMSGVQINADPVAHPDIFKNQMSLATEQAIEKEILSATDDNAFRKNFLSLLSSQGSETGHVTTEQSMEDLRIILSLAEQEIPADADTDFRLKHQRSTRLKEISEGIVELYEKRKGIDDESDESNKLRKINLRKSVGLLPLDALNAAPVQSGTPEGKTTPPPAPGQEQQQQPQPGEQPSQEKENLWEYNGVPLKTEADFDNAVNQMKSDVEDAIKRGDRAAVEKMLGRARNWWKDNETGKFLTKAGRIGLWTVMILGVAYVAGLWVATRYRGGKG